MVRISDAPKVASLISKRVMVILFGIRTIHGDVKTDCDADYDLASVSIGFKLENERC